MKERLLPGPGSIRVGTWIGRLGVAALPAVAVGLEVHERVVRRHAARLQEAEWLARAPGAWGEGSVVWLTPSGTRAVGLGALRAVSPRSAPSRVQVAHGVLVSWSAAQAQRRGERWQSARELALERHHWEVEVRSERGRVAVLPDLAVCPAPGETPTAVVIETGSRRTSRQRAILEGWREAIRAGRYAAVRYECSGEQAATRINHLAAQAGLGRPVFLATAQMLPAEVAALPRTQPLELRDRSPATAARSAPERDGIPEPPVAPGQEPDRVPHAQPAEPETSTSDVLQSLQLTRRRAWRSDRSWSPPKSG